MTEQEQPRITPAAALAAYLQTGKTPKQCIFVGRDCACGIGIMHVASGKPYEMEYPHRDIRVPANEMYGRDYVGGFMDGFDGCQLEEDVVLTDRERQGYEDGKAVWAAVQHLATP